MKICPKCGTSCGDDMRFCLNCGASLNFGQAEAGASQSNQTAYESTNTGNNHTGMEERGKAGFIKERNIALCIIFSIITCGIYYLYWMAVETNEMNELLGDTNDTSGAMAVVLSIVTCGIYKFYWEYKMGEKVDRLKGVQSNTGLVYLIICLIGWDIVDMCLIQDTINKAVR